MEIPDNLKLLYKHWSDHTVKPITTSNIKLNQDVLNQMYPMVVERMNIWEAKQNDKKLPYTNNPILAKYRFCNIYRELDRQTIEIHTQLKHIEDNFELWLLNIIFHRMVCKPNTVSKVGFLNYESKNNKLVLNRLQSLSRPKYGVAYIFPISIVNKVGMSTREEFFCLYLPKIVKQCAEVIRDFNKISVVDALNIVLPKFGLNFKFHWTEVLIDVAYQYPRYIDLYEKFPIGPGSLPTMKKLNKDADPVEICLSLTKIEIPGFPYLTYEGRNVWLSSENWEGIGCEFRKYTNLMSGAGRKRIYS